MSTSIRCQSCGKTVGSEAALGQHTRAKHSGDPIPLPSRPSRWGEGQKWNWSGDSSPSASSTSSSGDSSLASSQTSVSSTAGDDRWSPALSKNERQGVVSALARMCHSRSTLTRKRFPLVDDPLCLRCKQPRGHNEVAGDPGCRYHTGDLGAWGTYSCCGKQDRGCVSSQTHSYPDPTGPINKTPAPNKSRPKKAVVALDCEMVQVKPAGAYKSHGECVSLTAVDVLTGDVLINSLVNPDAPITCWLERLTGVSPKDLHQARKQGKALKGFKGARAELFKHIDSKTILVGHALENDLKVLRIAHDSIVDTQIVADSAVQVKGQSCGLKTLCRELVGQEIQKGVHSSIEDTMATREVLLCLLRNPDKLETWGAHRRGELSYDSDDAWYTGEL